MTLPLWSPTHVELGAVGYLLKPKGEFITLFNAVDPLQSCDERLRHLPSMYGYGKFEVQKREEAKRSVAQRSLDAISVFLTFKTRGDRSHPYMSFCLANHAGTDKVNRLGNESHDSMRFRSCKENRRRICAWRRRCTGIWTLWKHPRHGLSNM